MRLKLHKIANLALGLIAAIALPSCLQVETTVTLNKDGSGTIVEEAFLTAKGLEMMKQFAQPDQPDPLAEMFSEDKAKEKASTFGEDVEFVKVEMIEEDGKKGARYHYKFADINKLTLNPGDSMDSLNPDAAAADEDDDKESLKFSYADGKLKLIVPPADFKEMNMDGAEEGGEQEEMMKQMMADMRVSMLLVIADGIAETNATYVNEDTITLVDMNIGKMFEQKDKLKEISTLAETDMDAAKAAFNKLDGIKIETNEDVTVTLK